MIRNKKIIEDTVAEYTKNEEQLKYLLRDGSTSTKLIAMFNPLILNIPLNAIDELKKDKNKFIKFNANVIEISKMLRLDAISIDSIADKEINKQKNKIQLIKNNIIFN